ncbi:recombination mediator RecR [Hydrogenibacillus schlegelii]|uniref:Recombination protein RecR n=1 Tax=Hydrogenibacillus schlegelii TaxID=1484 RepID=A0A132NDR6_HYDSH|nr:MULTISPECIES: recombination mediator RecR [Hydrogenibacillus]KWX08126.1 recombinase RecR [Hydrogenibacillus schlegelii]MBT9282010.1 recombination mediator RecR [Hydrogenibacillus schlegelii]OAR04132.1 recombination protein RecR [Hydrogenibacillus schlegelii]QZA33046.1 recombination mediator RecR [Hydrogenibacillus sp. N12]
MHYPEPLARLIEAFQKLPGIGPKTATRLAFYVLKLPDEDVRALAEALQAVKRDLKTCSICHNVTDRDPCAICSDPTRDRRTICVVEEPKDVAAMEKMKGYRGLYHVLGGVLSPLDGIGPEELKIKSLLERLQDETVEEVIIATNPSVEGEATAVYLARLIKPSGIRVTRIASGLPVGGDLEYADEVTLARALEGRRDV